jgi:hypothetical protein
LALIPVCAQEIPEPPLPVDYRLEGNTLYFLAGNSTIIDKKQFNDPRTDYIDLDKDNVDEFVVVDMAGDSTAPSYYVYVYGIDSVIYLIDSLPSGRVEPYFELNEELQKEVIAVGAYPLQPFFLGGEQDTLCIPLLFYQYDEDGLTEISEEFREFYLNENRRLAAAFAASLKQTDCSQTQRFRSALLTAYFNYRKAGEFTLAEQFFKQYYHCADGVMVKSYIDLF